MNCPSCGTPAPAGAAFCDNCGASLSGVAPAPPPVQAPASPGLAPTAAVGGICPSCHQPVISGQAFCDNCGAALANVPAVAPPPPQLAPPPPMMPPAPPIQQPVAAPSAGLICPSCGTPATAGAAFCDNCGASLTQGQPVQQQPWQQQPPVQQQPWQQQPPVQQQPWQQQPPVQQQPWQQQPPVVHAGPPPRLVIQATNVALTFPAGKAEIIAGREDPVSNVFPEVNLDPHGGDEAGVSRRHARFTVQGAQWYVQDLNSINFTFVNKNKLQPNQLHPVNHGDEVRLGKIIMTFMTH